MLSLLFLKHIAVSNVASIVCIRVSTPPPPPQKQHPTLSCQAPPPFNLQTAQAPFLGNSPSISVFHELPPTPKCQIFQRTHKILKFSSLTPSYILKLTKFLVKISQFEFLVKISQFEFLVMIKKNIFVYIHFCH